MREKEKNDRKNISSIKKDTIEIMKAKKELEDQTKKEIQNDIEFRTVYNIFPIYIIFIYKYIVNNA